MIFGRTLFSLFLLFSTVPRATAGLKEVIAAFREIRNTTLFPVEGRKFNSIEETFGPRRQPTLNGAYDWHRGIDINGKRGERIIAVYDGTFDGLRSSVSAGNYVVLKHVFPAGANPPLPFGPNPDRSAWTTFYTYYLHLDDATLPLVQDWPVGKVVHRGDLIGYLGSTGGSGGEEYAPHLHFELRFGTSNPLSSQIEEGGLSPTDAWFDPHMHPMLLFNPESKLLRGTSTDVTYTQTLIRLTAVQEPSAPVPPGKYFLYVSSTDDLPILNRFRVDVLEDGTSARLKRYVLDLNTRAGFDASTNEKLDTRHFRRPYIEPMEFAGPQKRYRTRLIVPDEWLGELKSRRVRVTATDIWGRSVALISR